MLFVVHPFPLSPFNPLSPRLDLNGNSVRGILFAKELTKEYQMHIFENLSDAKMKVKQKEPQKEPQKKQPPTNPPEQNTTQPSGYHSTNNPHAVTSSWHLDVSDLKMNPLKVTHPVGMSPQAPLS